MKRLNVESALSYFVAFSRFPVASQSEFPSSRHFLSVPVGFAVTVSLFLLPDLIIDSNLHFLYSQTSGRRHTLVSPSCLSTSLYYKTHTESTALEYRPDLRSSLTREE
jgi:hypothetical protein